MKAEISVSKAALWADALQYVLRPLSPGRRTIYISIRHEKLLRELQRFLEQILEEA